MRFCLDMRMVRPNVSQFVVDQGSIEDWDVMADGMYTYDFQDQESAYAWNNRFKTYLNTAFADEPMYLFYSASP